MSELLLSRRKRHLGGASVGAVVALTGLSVVMKLENNRDSADKEDVMTS
jgi:hypothetical protein